MKEEAEVLPKESTLLEWYSYTVGSIEGKVISVSCCNIYFI